MSAASGLKVLICCWCLSKFWTTSFWVSSAVILFNSSISISSRRCVALLSQNSLSYFSLSCILLFTSLTFLSCELSSWFLHYYFSLSHLFSKILPLLIFNLHVCIDWIIFLVDVNVCFNFLRTIIIYHSIYMYSQTLYKCHFLFIIKIFNF